MGCSAGWGTERTTPNRVGERVESAMLGYSPSFPTHGPLRATQQLVQLGVQASASGRDVWSRHERLLRLELIA